MERYATVQCRLSTERQEYAVRTFLLDDPLHEIGSDGQEVDFIGHPFRGLHGGDVRIDEHRTDAFFLQGFQCLRTRIVEFPCLSYLQCS